MLNMMGTVCFMKCWEIGKMTGVLFHVITEKI